MILGIDVGNYATKVSNGTIFQSKVSKVGNILGGDLELILDGQKIYVGSGEFETDFNKAKKESFMQLLYAAIALSSKDDENQIVVGLPIGQYKEFKEVLRARIKDNWYKELIINNNRRTIYITDVEVMPEGAIAAGDDFEGILIDIGGRSTDTCLIRLINGRKKILNPISIPQGTINLFSDMSKLLNSKYALDLKLEDTEIIVKKGLKINGVDQNIDFVSNIFKDYVDSLINKLKLDYSLSTEDVLVIGGGGSLLYKSIKKRIPQAEIKEDSIFANAQAYGKVGEDLWL